MITDPRKWRVSKSGYSIRTGWGTEKKLIAAYPHTSKTLDPIAFQSWLDNAELICELYNATLLEEK